jgi:hypothetical protein
LTWEIRGWGQSREDAELDALKKARTEILDYLREQGVVLEHGPTERDVRPLVKEWSEDESREVQGIGELRQAKLKVELTSKNLAEFVQQDRQVRSQQRMLWLGKILAVLVALLSAVAGYCRLEEATKGYYTAWLRVVALGFVTAVGAGLWLLS